MESLEIRTERLLSVPLEEEMAENVHLNSLDEDTRRFVPDEVFATVDQAREVIRSLRECYRSAAGPFVFAVLLHSGENIGYVQAVPAEQGWEVGYHIAAAHTGRGYATEAVQAFLPAILPRLKSQEIWGICRSDNPASRRVLEKCGFELVFSGTGLYQGKVQHVCRYVFLGS